MGKNISTFVMEIFTPEDSNLNNSKLGPVGGSFKLFFWIGATMVLTNLVSKLQ